MKKLLVLLIPILIFHFHVKAQTEAVVITQLHALLQSAKNNFQNDIGKKIDEDASTKTIYYETLKSSEAAETFIVHQATGQNMYVITYDGKGDKIAKMIPIVNQYIDELNNMVKSGNYSGEDYKDKNGKDVTDVKDKAGNLVLRYASNTATQTIYLYGFANALEQDKELSETEKRMVDIKAGKFTHGAAVKLADRVTNFSVGRFSEVITWGMMGTSNSGFKRYFISPTLYSKKYPVPFGARFVYQLVNSKKELVSEQIKYGNELECYFDVPTDGDYTIQAAYDFDGCTGCNTVSAIRVMFGLYSLEFTKK